MKISLVISDVDGTLITPEHEITKLAQETVDELRGRGIRFTLASSRPPRGLKNFAKKLKLTEPFAAFNGAVIQNPGGQTLRTILLNKTLCKKVYSISKNYDLQLWVYCDQDWHIGRVTSYVEREQNTSGFAPVVEDYLPAIFGKAAKLTVVGDPKIIAKAEPDILTAVGDKVSATKSKPRFIDITSAKAHKGTVVTYLSETCKILETEIAVIGDGSNDVLMFEKAGLSIAMGQSSDDVREAATETTEANTEEGFAKAMKKHVLFE